MAEKIEDIAKSIERHCEKEVFKRIPNRAYGRSFVNFGGEEKALWLTNKPNHGGFINVQDITGAVIGTQSGNDSTLKEDGDPIYKNSPLGELLIRFTKGTHIYKAPRGNLKVEIFSSAKYTPSEEELATDLTVQLAEEDNLHAYRTLKHLLNELKGIDSDIESLRQAEEQAKTQQERNEILKRIAEKESARKSKLDKAQSFIRKYAELRYQPILDATQEMIKRAEIFSKTIAINGGPGTGKTTTLIQRIKFLLDLVAQGSALTEEERQHYIGNLTPDKQSKLKESISWIFFSPSELLKLFLQNSMTAEGLDASHERLKVWSDYKQELIRGYKLVNTETQRPFLFYRKKENENVLLPIETDALKRVIKAFMDFYLNYQNDKLTKLSKLDVSGFEWKNLGSSIQQYINRALAENGIDNLIRLYHNLNQNYQQEAEKVSAQYAALIKDITAKWIQTIQKDENLVSKVKEVLKNKKVAETDEEDELDSEDFDETNSDTDDFEIVLFSRIKSLIRKQALSAFDKDTRNTSEDKALLELIPALKTQPEYLQIGQLAYFKKFIERACKGVITNLYREIPMLYKRFRKANTSNSKMYEPFVANVVRDENKRLHDDEQAFLLYIINRLVARLQRILPALYAEGDSAYIKAHKQFKRNIIGIDEATDFHLIDLLAIRSLGDPELNSLTLSGDLMQRMTQQGIRSWEALESFLKDEEGFRKEDIVISYRQSPTLLELAKKIYEQANGREIDFKSFIKRDESEPIPLRFKSTDEAEKVQWLSERILEIYKAYGESIPSIAIFTQDDETAQRLEREFKDIDHLADVGIYVKACNRGEVLGNENTVRIFAVPYIKGLEFEAVFFHNIDDLKTQSELLYKYLYVALSRATFYLAVTHSTDFSDNTNYLNEYFSINKNWKL